MWNDPSGFPARNFDETSVILNADSAVGATQGPSRLAADFFESPISYRRFLRFVQETSEPGAYFWWPDAVLARPFEQVRLIRRDDMPAKSQNRNILLVGRPLANARQVFDECAARLGELIPRMPDGETGV